MKDLRLIPIVIIASFGLLVLKLMAFMDSAPRSLGPKSAVAQSMSEAPVVPAFLGAPGASVESNVQDYPDLITGSAPAKKKEEEKPKEDDGKTSPAEGRLIITEPPKDAIPPTERAILERLQARRNEIEARGKEVDMRESELRALEKRLEERANQIKELEARINSAVQKRDEAEVQRIKNVVIMYENMRPKDAARIFDELDLSVQLDVANFMKPPKLADILAAMRSDTAKRLTTELARKPASNAEVLQPANMSTLSPPNGANLPKIDGKPKP